MVTFYRRLPRFNYLSPKTIDEALSLLSQHKGKARVVAGGTDLLPEMKRREIRALAPELGQHTEEILLEMGYGWDDISKLEANRIIM